MSQSLSNEPQPDHFFRNVSAACQTNEPLVPATAGPEVLPWYAIRVRCHGEKNVARALESKGYEQYSPFYRKQNRWSDRIKTIDLPLFPGYVFCRLEVALRRPVLTIPGVVNLVGFGNIFVPIPENEIQAVQDIVRSGLPSLPWPFLREGECIRVRTGALAGLEGFLVHIKNEFRVVVSIPLLQRSVAVQIDRDWIQPLPGSPAASAARTPAVDRLGVPARNR